MRLIGIRSLGKRNCKIKNKIVSPEEMELMEMSLREELFNLLLVELHSSNNGNFSKLYKILLRFRDNGMTKEDMYECLEGLREACDSVTEDMVLDLMDLVVGFCNPRLDLFPPKPRITMELYETDVPTLQHFIENTKPEGEVTEEYLILQNFATDCKYAEQIQSELILYLLPFYLRCARESVLSDDRIAIEAYLEFNMAMFFNHESFKWAVGESSFQYIMETYIELTIAVMNRLESSILEWVSQFNTVIALWDKSIWILFEEIRNGSLQVKYAFFRYLSVLLFKESDNLLALNETRDFWSSDIWNFDDGYFGKKFFWSEAAIVYYDEEVTQELIENLYAEVEPILCENYSVEIIGLLREEMNSSFENGVFKKRKAEFLKKIGKDSIEYVYWDETF